MQVQCNNKLKNFLCYYICIYICVGRVLSKSLLKITIHQKVEIVYFIVKIKHQHLNIVEYLRMKIL